MAALNGKSLSGGPSAPPDPRPAVAEAVYTIMMDEGDPAFNEIDDEDRADILALTGNYLTAHIGWLQQQGYRLIPPGVTPIPTSPEEALAMVQAAQRFLDSQKRKSGLIGMKKPKLIVPPGAH